MSSITIIDVRTPAEFMGGHVAGSINIPLGEIPGRVQQIADMPGPIILCCASGGRSGQAMVFLKGYGVDCSNGGGWTDVSALMNNGA